MDITEFEHIAESAMVEHPQWFLAFDEWKADIEDIAEVERRLEVHLPEKYKWFMRNYGGGAFGFTDILPLLVPEEGEDSVLSVNVESSWSVPFVAASPVGTGDWWGFLVNGGDCSSEVHFIDHEDGSTTEQAVDFLDFVNRFSLKS